MALLTVLALVGFAANSLLCRAALAGGEGRAIDAASFTGVRLAAGAVVLWLLVRARGRGGPSGRWASALALFAYAAGFSLAYVQLPAGVGALLLFGCVQATMIAAGLLRGERPRALEWTGLVVALVGLVALTAPGASAPAPVGATLMAGAGVAWGIYSLRGRGSSDPLGATAGNFLLAAPLVLPLLLLGKGALHMDTRGVLLAAASGALASGLGYSLWYAALRALTTTRAAVVQLCVPVLAAVGGVLLLGEALTARLVWAGGAVLAGVGLATLGRARAQPPQAPPRAR
ncbi:MAG: DMT family transporter [Myxococcaceae bacterium]|nr:DMT family transporter [Myxococcaceae bacterium]MCI0672425.1 DMT family transporter [Myxococcaceae bacterium]